MRKGFDGLSAQVRNILQLDPFSGAVFLFRGKRGDRLKALVWDGSGLCLYAKRLRQPPKGCLFHSDRGSQYCSYDYQKKLQAYGLRPSMSGKGNCYDNASVETFFKSLKAELIWRQSWPTRRQAEAAIFQYINGFYNTRRRQSYLGGISPLAFEAKVA